MHSVFIPVPNTTFQFDYLIPEDTFFDPDHGNTRNLRLFLYNEDGTELAKSSWIDLAGQTVRLFSSKEIVSRQPAGGYKFRLSAIDPEPLENHTTVTVMFQGSFPRPNYLRIFVSKLSASLLNIKI